MDDHRVVAEALAALLGLEADLEVIGIAETVREAVHGADASSPDVVLLDWRLPDGTGADAAAAIRARHPDAALLFLSADDSTDALLDAVSAGACGFLLKSSNTGALVQAVRDASAGEMLLPPARLAELLGRQRERAREEAERNRLLAEMTPREHEVLGLMAQGLNNRQIGARLQISYETVRTHVKRVIDKLDSRTRLQAVMRAIEAGLI